MGEVVEYRMTVWRRGRWPRMWCGYVTATVTRDDSPFMAPSFQLDQAHVRAWTEARLKAKLAKQVARDRQDRAERASRREFVVARSEGAE